MTKAKMKIVLAAIELFNERGLVNVLNQDIASAAGMSLSNFNYHFKTKKDLVYLVCTYMKDELERRIAENQVLTTKGLELEISKIYFEFGSDYRFFYLDTHNILQTYPAMKEGMQEQIEKSILIIKNLNYMSVGMGYMKPEPEDLPGLYDKLALQIWINHHFWLAQMNIRDKEDNSIIKGLEYIFSIFYPHLTKKGIKAYKNYIALQAETVVG